MIWVPVVAVAAVLGFLVGSINPAALLARALRKDIRGGSGNPGATNASRVLGLRWGVLVGVLDVLKGLLPVLVALRVAGLLAALVVGLAVVLGHMFSPFLRGAGGKGVATAFGAVLAVQPWVALVMFGVFMLVLTRVRWVAAGSLTAALVLFLYGAVAAAGWAGDRREDQWVGVWCVSVALLVVARHHRNIVEHEAFFPERHDT